MRSSPREWSGSAGSRCETLTEETANLVEGDTLSLIAAFESWDANGELRSSWGSDIFHRIPIEWPLPKLNQHQQNTRRGQSLDEDRKIECEQTG